MALFGGSKAIVGLDIGSSCIKAVELKRTRGGIEVAHLGLEPLASRTSKCVISARKTSGTFAATGDPCQPVRPRSR